MVVPHDNSSMPLRTHSQITDMVDENNKSIHETQRGRICKKRNVKIFVLMFIVAFIALQNVVHTRTMLSGVANGRNRIIANFDFDAAPAENEDRNMVRERGSDNQDNNGNISVSLPAIELHDEQNISIAFVTFSHLSNITQFEHTILASANTWVPSESNYYVVLNQMWERKFMQWKKQKIDNFYSTQTNDTTSATESIVGIHRIQPIYVDCPEGRFGESPCCKQQQGLVNFHKMHYYDKQNRKAKYDWILFSDDDVYIVPTVLEKFIRYLPYGLPSQKEMIQSQLKNEEPLVLVQSGPSILGQHAYLKHHSPYKCSKDNEFKYPWGQPVVYNRAALERILPGLEQNGLVKQCVEYGVTHDVGNALLHWMYSIPSVKFRFPNAKQQLTWKRGKRNWKFRGDSIGYHGAGVHESLKMEWFHEETRHERRRIETMNNVPFNRSNLPREDYFEWQHVNGFNQTATFEKYGDPGNWSEWHTMPTFDCKQMSPDVRQKWNLTV